MRLIKDGNGMGSFLAPPGHPAHEWSVKGGRDSWWSLTAAVAEGSGVSSQVRDQAQALLDNAHLSDSDLWERHLYGYFRNSYSPDGADRDVSHAVMTGKVHCACGAEAWNNRGLASHLSQHEGDPAHHEIAVPLPPPEHHLAVLAIREYFPDHQPRLDLIADPGKGYGSYPCAKCGKRVQYEARYDKLCVISLAGNADPVCASGGDHEI